MERDQAIEMGLKTYITGRPCKHGHNGVRYTLSGTCFECVRNSNSARRKVAREAIKKAAKG